MTLIITCSQCGHKDWYVLQQSKAQRKTAKQRGLTGYASAVPNATGAQSWQPTAPQAQSGYITHASRAPSLDDVFVPFLWAAGSGAVVFIGSAVTAYALHAPKPLLCSFVAGWGALAFKWFGGLGFVQKSIWWLEEIAERDLDGDGSTGKPQKEIINPIPVYHQGKKHVIDAPGPPAPQQTVRLNRTERTMPLQEFGDYLLWAQANKWTRRAAEQRGVSQTEWPLIKEMLDRWGLWKTTDRPALLEYLFSLGYREPTKPTNQTKNQNTSDPDDGAKTNANNMYLL